MVSSFFSTGTPPSVQYLEIREMEAQFASRLPTSWVENGWATDFQQEQSRGLSGLSENKFQSVLGILEVKPSESAALQ